MDIIFIVLVDIIVLLFVAMFIKKMTGSFSLFKIEPVIYVFLFEFFVSCWIGSSIFYAGYGTTYYSYWITSNPSTQKLVWVTVLYASFTVFFIMMSMNYFTNNSIYKLTQRNQCVPKIQNDNNTYCIVVILLFLCFLYYLLYASNIGYIPIVELFTANTFELAEHRYLDKFEFTGNSIIRNIFMFVLPVILSYVCFIGIHGDKRYKWWFAFILSFIVVLLCTTSRYEKGIFIKYLLGFILLPKNYKNNTLNQYYGLNNKKRMPLGIILIFIFSMFYSALVMQGDISLNSMLENSIHNRLIYSQIAGLYRHYDLFPTQIPFLHFMYYPSFIASIFGELSIRSSRIVMQASSSNEFAGHMNSIFLAEAYANGGWTAVFLSPFVVGVSIFVSFWIFYKMKDTAINRACFIYWCLQIPITGGFLDFLYCPTYIIIIIIAIIMNKIIDNVIIWR